MLSTATQVNSYSYQGTGSSSAVTNAIAKASAQSGVSFSYLLQKAEQESGLNPSAKAQGSSATGLYQFVEQTWLREMKAHGADYGYSDLASKISIGSDGTARVSDTTTKKQILALRNDPTLSSQMAAELTKDNKTSLEQKVGGSIGGTELYLAHFLGAGGAANFLNTMKTNPNAKAADILPTAASSNPSVFYDKSGQARSLKQVYAMFDKKFDGLDSNTTGTALAQASSRQQRMASIAGAAGQADTSENALAAQMLGGTSSATSSSAAAVQAALSNTSFSTSFSAMLLAQMDTNVLGQADSARASDTQNDRKRSLYEQALNMFSLS